MLPAAPGAAGGQPENLICGEDRVEPPDPVEQFKQSFFALLQLVLELPVIGMNNLTAKVDYAAFNQVFQQDGFFTCQGNLRHIFTSRIK
jgi:hypothetical protein